MDDFFNGTSENKMDENWGYSYFRKPPYVFHYDTMFVFKHLEAGLASNIWLKL